MEKTFQGDLLLLSQKLANHECFAFNRFSDGELIIFQNKELILGNNLIKIGNTISSGPYKKEDFKHFNPKEHQFFRERLIDSFRFSKNNYFKGICCSPCCTREEDFDWQIHFMESGKDEWLTWANLFVNNNYFLYMQYIFPLFYNYKTVIICNENANISKLPFVVKDFRVGENAMINDYNLIETIKRWIMDNHIESHLFLFSASAFSKMAVHQLYSFNDKNTYMDIGTTLNPLIGLRADRSYLRSYWFGSNEPDINKRCVWKKI
jgi:hypothetical protein